MGNRARPALHLVLGLIIVFGFGLRVDAQEPASEAQVDEPPAADPAPGSTLDSAVDEITVVGLRSDVTNVQDEAQAITAFTNEDLDKANIINVDGLAFNVPGLHVGQLGNRAIVTLRAIGTENAFITGEPGVSFLVDGVNIGRPEAARVAFFDLEGLQVVRGPQGTRGGKNATAGWIKVFTAKPHDEYAVEGDIQFGDYNQRKIRGSLNLPINELVQTRFAVTMEERDGYQKNFFFNDDDRDAFDADDLGFRGHVRMFPTDSFENLFTYNFYEAKGNGPLAKLLPDPKGCPPVPRDPSMRPHPVTNPNLPQPPTVHPQGVGCRPAPAVPSSQSQAFNPHGLFTNIGPSQENVFWGWANTATWQVPSLPIFGDTQLKSITGFQQTDLYEARDGDSTDIQALAFRWDIQVEQHSQEFQWTGNAADLADWQLSLVYQREFGDSLLDLTNFDQEDIAADQSTNTKAYGAAFHTDIYLNEQLTLGGGLRYTKDTKRSFLYRQGSPTTDGSNLQTCLGGAEDTFIDGKIDQLPDEHIFAPGVQIDWPLECKRSWRDLSGGARLEWRPTGETLLYASADRGFKSGGFSAFGPDTYVPETIKAYSIGAKNSFFDDRFTLNVEAFFWDYDDLQIVELDGTQVVTDNAKAIVQGVELEFSASPIDGFRFSGQASYLDTEIEELSGIDPAEANRVVLRIACERRALQGAISLSDCPPEDDLSGNRLSRAPEWSLTLIAEYDFILDRFGILTPRIQYYWQDDTFYRVYNTPLDLQDAYSKTDLRLSWQSPEERYSLEFFIDNLEDNAAFQNVFVGTRVLGSPRQAWYSNPRVWGIRAGFKF